MRYQDAFNYLVDDLEGDSGKPSFYGDTFGINSVNWNLCWKWNGLHNLTPTHLDAFQFYKLEYWTLKTIRNFLMVLRNV